MKRGARRPRGGSEAGAITFSGIMLILVVVAIIFAAYKLLPPYVDNYRLQDSLDNIARNSTYSYAMTEADVRKQVKEEARLIGIPLQDNQIEVHKAGVDVAIQVHYGLTVDLLVHQVDLEFSPAAGNRNILAKP
jgi:hypothetical protein